MSNAIRASRRCVRARSFGPGIVISRNKIIINIICVPICMAILMLSTSPTIQKRQTEANRYHSMARNTTTAQNRVDTLRRDRSKNEKKIIFEICSREWALSTEQFRSRFVAQFRQYSQISNWIWLHCVCVHWQLGSNYNRLAGILLTSPITNGMILGERQQQQNVNVERTNQFFNFAVGWFVLRVSLWWTKTELIDNWKSNNDNLFPQKADTIFVFFFFKFAYWARAMPEEWYASIQTSQP